MHTRLHPALAILTLTLLPLSQAPVVCDEAEVMVVPAAPAGEPSEPPMPATWEPAAQIEVPEIIPDTDIFKRTPRIDGTIDDGEWDTYYTFTSGEWEVTTFADWDADSLYLAAKSTRPIDFLASLDASGDGWYHGEDNYEFRAIREADESIALTVGRYESRGTTSAAVAWVTPAEASMVEVKSNASEDGYAIEMRVPANLVRGFRLAPDRHLGLQIAVKTDPQEDAWIPADAPGDTRPCVLVAKKIAALKPLRLGFDLLDYRLARGDELVGKFHLTNSGTDPVDVRTFVIAGEGKAGDYLSSERIRIEGLPPGKHISREIKSIIPSDMALGSWAIGAEVRSDESRLGGALVSFEVVEPFDVRLSLPGTPVRTDVKDVTFGAVVDNNLRRSLRGTVKITLPVGWELWKDADTRDFSARAESSSSVAFKAKPPLGALGSVPVSVEVTADGITQKAESFFEMVSP